MMDPLEKSIDSKAPLPKGYVFVAKGNVYITRHCRERTRKANRVVYIVHDKTSKLRIGLACPDHILREVQADERATAAHRKQQVATKDKTYIANARVTLLRIFPRIPPGSAEEVLQHGYLKGSGRVGRSSTMSDANKMIMAVTAHARHKHTPYDALLREKGPGQAARFEARAQIRGQLLEVLRKWGMVGQLRSLEPDTDLDTGDDSSRDGSYASDNVLEHSCVDIMDVGTPEPRDGKTWKEGSPVVFGGKTGKKGSPLVNGSKTWREGSPVVFGNKTGKTGSPVVFGKGKARGKANTTSLKNSIRAPKTVRSSPKPKAAPKASTNRVRKVKTTKKTVRRKRPNVNKPPAV